MADAAFPEVGGPTRHMRVDTFAGLRWLAICGQIGAIFVARYALDLEAPLTTSLFVIAPSVLINLFLRMRYAPSHRLREATAAAMLGFDVVQLAGLLYLTGGLGNPFSIMFLAPVMISSTSLPLRSTIALGALVVVSAGILVINFRPLPWFRDEDFALPFHYLIGVWLTLSLAVIFVSVYATRVSEEARRLADALAATDLALAEAQHIRELDGLAAAAAHALGSPLGTILVAARELARALPPADPAAEDAALILTETARCRAILGRLASWRDDEGGPLDEIDVGQLLGEATAAGQRPGVEISIELEGAPPAPRCRRNPGVAYGLSNLVDNAVAFAASRVRVAAHWDASRVRLSVADDGPGFSPGALAQIGDPYIGSSGRRRGENGLGLGLFIAKTLIERSGGRLEVANRGEPAAGAEARLVWPRAVFERGLAPAGGARAVLEEGRAAPAAAAARTPS